MLYQLGALKSTTCRGKRPSSVAHDVRLEAAIDGLALTAGWRLEKSNMFGGLAYFTHGNMCFAIMGEALLFRVGKEWTTDYLRWPGVHEATMGSRTMRGWLLAGGEAVADASRLQALLDVGYGFAATLPPK